MSTIKLGALAFICAILVCVALLLMTNQSLTLLHAPDALRLVLDVGLFLGETVVGTFAIGFLVKVNNAVDDLTGGLFSNVNAGVVLGAVLSAVIGSGLIWLFASMLLHMSGLAFGYVVVTAFAATFLLSLLSLKRLAGVFGFLSDFLPRKR